jgi:Fe-S cluster assembly protein SufB
MPTETSEIETLANREYKWGFVTDIEADSAPPGLNEDIILFISAKKNEPKWLLDWRLKAFRHWQTMEEPHWPFLPYGYGPIDYQGRIYYPAPTAQKKLEEIDPKLLEMYEKLGVPLHERNTLLGIEQPNIAVDAVMDSVSVTTTFKKELAERGIIFCGFSEAVLNLPELVQKYLGSVVP